MTALLGLPGWNEGWTARRGGEVARRFRDAFAAQGRGADVVWVLAGQFGNMDGPLIDEAIAWSRSNDFRVGAIAAAPYFDSGLGEFTPPAGWSVAQQLDLFRHYLRWGPKTAQFMANYRAACARYDAALGGHAERVTYEGAVEKIAGVNPWDWAHHPDVGDTERVRWALLQDSGITLDTYYALLSQPDGVGNNWGLWDAQDEIAGTGDGSDGRAVNQSTGQLNPANVSPRGEAWRRWQRAYWMGQVPRRGIITGTTAGLRKAG
jgi:hypothetical protein